MVGTFTWNGGTADWFAASQWAAPVGLTGAPTTGDIAVINSGTVSLNGSDEITNVPVDGDELIPLNGVSVTLGSTSKTAPAAIVATSALFDHYFTITSTGTYADALLTAIGPTGYHGTIIADASGGVFTIKATQEDGAEPADLVLLDSASIQVSGGDDLVVNGLVTAESNVTIASGGTLTNDGTIRMFGGSVTLSAGSVLNGTGAFIMGPDATLYAETTARSSETFAFDGAGRLDIGTLSAFAGKITDFVVGSTIDLLNSIANYASYDAGTGKLIIEDSGTTIGTLTVQGPTVSGTLTAVSDGSSGTVIDIPGSASRISYEIDTADQAMGANVVRATMTTVDGAPIIGTGITIGIMSSSFNATLNGVVDPADTAAQQGYLPATESGTSAVDVLKDSSLSGVDNEGLAMAELVHQVAPGAQIDFYTAEGTQDDFAAGVTALANAGANIIVDDWSFSNTPFFQIAGPADTAVENAISAGVDYFTDASNYDNAYFQAAWQGTPTQLVLTSGDPAQSVTAQQFDNGTELQLITVPGSITSHIDLEWNAAWPSPGTSVPDSLGMAFYNMAGTLVATSTQVTDTADGYDGLPEISLTVSAQPTSTDYQLAIYQIANEPTILQFKYIAFGSPESSQDPGAVIDDPDAGIGSGAVHDWALVPGVNTVGAAYWANSPSGDVASDWTEGFSSDGPGQLLYDQNGNPLSPSESAGKVDFVGPDGVETSVPNFQPFFGTSAATPDAAAVAALMLQADPSLTTSQVTSMLAQSALDMGLPAADQGAGLVQAPGAVQLAIDAQLASRTLQWIGAADTNFANAKNWDDLTDDLNPATAAPVAGDTAILSTDSGTITGTGTVAHLAVESGNWTLGAAADVTYSAFDVGDSSAGSTTLTLSNGATLIGGSTDFIAELGTSNSGTVTVDGSGSTWTTVGGVGIAEGSSAQVIVSDDGNVATSFIFVGAAAGGAGSLAIESGGTVSNSGAFYVGFSAGNTGSVLVDDGRLNLDGGLIDGLSGAGAVTIDPFGSVSVIGAIDVGYSVGAAGILSAHGSVSASGGLEDGLSGAGTVDIGAIGAMSVDGHIDVGNSAGAVGILSITDGGVLQDIVAPNTNTYELEVGINAASGSLAAGFGSVVVSGAGSLIDLGLNGASIGESGGTGTVIVSQGGTFIAATENSNLNNSLAIGRTGDGTMIVTDPGSEVEAIGDAYIAHSETGALTVENAGTFLAAVDAVGLAGLTIGAGSTVGVGGVGMATVTTDGILMSQGNVVVGSEGTAGELTASNAGTVEVGTSLVVGNTGMLSNGTVYAGDGAVTVTDPGSRLTALGETEVGATGAGNLLVENQATAVTGGSTIAVGLDVGTQAGAAGEVTVTGSQSLLDNTGEFIVGDGGVGSLSIKSGGTVITAPGTVVALAAAIIANTTAASGSSVFVIGADSSWRITGSLIVGIAAEGVLNIAAGGTVTATSLDAALQSGSDGVITVAGLGTALDLTGTATIGNAAAGELSILAGASVSAAGLTIGTATAASSGNVDVEGTGSTLFIDTGGFLNIGVVGGGSGELTIGKGTTLTYAGSISENGHASFNNNGGTVDPDAIEYTTPDNSGNGLNEYSLYVGNINAVQISAGDGIWDTPMVLTGTSVADAQNNIDNNSDVGEWQLSQGGTLVLNTNTIDAGQAIVFEDATDTLVIGQVVNGGSAGVSGVDPTVAPGAENVFQAGGFEATIWGYQAGDRILFDNMFVASDTIVGGNTLEVFIPGDATPEFLTFFNKTGNRALGLTGMEAAAAEIAADNAPCFAAGTRVATERGEVAVEGIGVGERVRVLLGGGVRGDGGELVGEKWAEVIWVGRREVDCSGHKQPKKVWPVRVSAGTFGPGCPHSDVWLSPDHAVYVEDVLIPVKCLLNGTTIAQVPRARVVYHHLELAAHNVLLAEGLPVESFLDMKDGSNYSNRPGPVRLYPDYSARMWEAYGCARLVVTGPELVAARALVASFAVQREAA